MMFLSYNSPFNFQGWVETCIYNPLRQPRFYTQLKPLGATVIVHATNFPVCCTEKTRKAKPKIFSVMCIQILICLI